MTSKFDTVPVPVTIIQTMNEELQQLEDSIACLRAQMDGLLSTIEAEKTHSEITSTEIEPATLAGALASVQMLDDRGGDTAGTADVSKNLSVAKGDDFADLLNDSDDLRPVISFDEKPVETAIQFDEVGDTASALDAASDVEDAQAADDGDDDIAGADADKDEELSLPQEATNDDTPVAASIGDDVDKIEEGGLLDEAEPCEDISGSDAKTDDASAPIIFSNPVLDIATSTDEETQTKSEDAADDDLSKVDIEKTVIAEQALTAKPKRRRRWGLLVMTFLLSAGTIAAAVFGTPLMAVAMP